MTIRIDKAELERLIGHEAGVSAAVEVDGDDVVLSGLVQTDGEREAALDIARAYAPEANIVDGLEVEGVLPEELHGMSLSDAEAAPGTSDEEALEPGDFTDQPILEDAWEASGPSGRSADREVSEGEEDYVPPTDPVRTRDNEFLGGFQTTAMDDDSEIDRGVLPGIADEALTEAVQLELREDASTAGLELAVTVEQGIATLRGEVQDMDDDENALAVAARVPGIIEVRDELRVRNV